MVHCEYYTIELNIEFEMFNKLFSQLNYLIRRSHFGVDRSNVMYLLRTTAFVRQPTNDSLDLERTVHKNAFRSYALL
jgi:hypothetical protein